MALAGKRTNARLASIVGGIVLGTKDARERRLSAREGSVLERPANKRRTMAGQDAL